MNKKKKQETIEDLLDDASSLPDGWLDDNIYDVTQTQARKKFKEVTDGVILDQLEYLDQQGYSVQRLRQLIDEAKKEQG